MGALLNPIEFILGLVLVIGIATTLGWTLASRSRPARLDKDAGGNGQSIMVAVNGSDESARAVELACRLASDRRARLILADVIQVPMRFALDAPLPQAEEKAARELRSAAIRATENHLQFEARIIKDRTAAGGLVRLARDARAGMLVVGFDGSLQKGLSDLVEVSELFRHTPCEVLVAREPVGAGQDGRPMGRLIEPSFHA